MFLQEFVGDGIPWAHLDIAGPADAAEDDGQTRKGGTGFGVRTLLHLLSTFRKPAKAASAHASRSSSRRRRRRSPARPTVARAAAISVSHDQRRPLERPSAGIWGTCWNGDTSIEPLRQLEQLPEQPDPTHNRRAPPSSPPTVARGSTPKSAVASPTSTHSAGTKPSAAPVSRATWPASPTISP